jgi:hypothetical protein
VATSIGQLVVELQANTAKFRADLDRASGDANKAGQGIKRGLDKGADGAANITKGFKEVALTTRQLGGALAGTISPALGEAVGLFGSLGSAMARLPVAAGVAVAGITAVVAASIPIAKKAADVIDTLAQIRTAAKTGDINSLTGIMKQSAAEIDKVQVAAEKVGNALPNIFRGEFAQAFQKIIANVRTEVERFSDSTQAAGQIAQEAGREFVKLLPDQTRVKFAEFTADVVKLRMGFNTLEAGIAESNNDLEEFTRLIERQRREAGELGSALEEVARAKAALTAIEITGSILDPAAQTAALKENNAELQRQIELIRQATSLTQKQIEQQGRTGTTGILERKFRASPAPFSDIPAGSRGNIETFGEFGELLSTDQIEKMRKNMEGVEKDLADLLKLYALLGDSVDVFGGKLAILARQMQANIATGLQPTDEYMRKLKDDFDTANVDAVMKDLATATRVASTEAELFGKGLDTIPDKIAAIRSAISLLAKQDTPQARAEIEALSKTFDELQVEELTTQFQRQAETFLMTERQLANYNAQLRLSAGAGAELRMQTEQTVNAMVDMAEQTRMVNDLVSIAVSGATMLGDALYDALTGQTDSFKESIRQIIHSLNRMILQMIIAELVAKSLRAALSGFGGVGGTSANVGAAIGTQGGGMAEGGIVRARSGGVWKLLGEGGQDEAVIPLSQLGGGGASVNVSVEIINQTGTPVSQQTEQSTGPEGQKMIRVFLRKEMAQAVGDGSLDSPLAGAFGLKRRGVSR